MCSVLGLLAGANPFWQMGHGQLARHASHSSGWWMGISEFRQPRFMGGIRHMKQSTYNWCLTYCHCRDMVPCLLHVYKMKTCVCMCTCTRTCYKSIKIKCILLQHDAMLHTALQYHQYKLDKIFNIQKTCLISNVYGLHFVGFWRKLVVLDGDLTMLCWFIPAPISCDETFTNLTGVINSPNYPSNYYNGASCHYSVTVPEGFVSDITVYNENREL